MKKLNLILILLVLVKLSMAQNLIYNGDFELWSNQSNMPDSIARGAGAVGTNYFYATDTEKGNVLSLIDTIASSVSARRFHSLTPISINSAGTYTVSFYVKGNVGLRSIVLTKGTGSPSTVTASATNHIATISVYPSGTVVNSWTFVSVDVIVPATATFGDDYRLHISWSSSSTAKPICNFLIDDIRLVRYDDSANADLKSISITPKDYSATTGTPDLTIKNFNSDITEYKYVNSLIDVPVISAEASVSGSTVSIQQPTSLTGDINERTATITVTSANNTIKTYTVELEKHDGFISGIPWDIRNQMPIEWSEIIGMYSRNSAINHDSVWAIGNTSIRCLATSESGYYLSTPRLLNGASTVSFYLNNADIANDNTVVNVLYKSDNNNVWTQLGSVTPNTTDWSGVWKKVTFHANLNDAGLMFKIMFDKSISTSGAVYLDDVEIQPYITTGNSKIETEKQKVFGVKGKIVFVNSENESYSVYNLSGQKITEGLITIGTTVSLPSGLYVVKIADEAYKVVI